MEPDCFSNSGEVPYLGEWGVVFPTATGGCLMQLGRIREFVPMRQILTNESLEIGLSQQACSSLLILLIHCPDWPND